jgi:hypothetical protein
MYHKQGITIRIERSGDGSEPDEPKGFWCKNSLTIQDIVEKESSKPL